MDDDENMLFEKALLAIKDDILVPLFYMGLLLLAAFIFNLPASSKINEIRGRNQAGEPLAQAAPSTATLEKPSELAATIAEPELAGPTPPSCQPADGTTVPVDQQDPNLAGPAIPPSKPLTDDQLCTGKTHPPLAQPPCDNSPVRTTDNPDVSSMPASSSLSGLTPELSAMFRTRRPGQKPVIRRTDEALRRRTMLGYPWSNAGTRHFDVGSAKDMRDRVLPETAVYSRDDARDAISPALRRRLDRADAALAATARSPATLQLKAPRHRLYDGRKRRSRAADVPLLRMDLPRQGNAEHSLTESPRPLTFGYTAEGRHLAVVREHVSDDPLTIYPVTAYGAKERA